MTMSREEGWDGGCLRGMGVAGVVVGKTKETVTMQEAEKALQRGRRWRVPGVKRVASCPVG